MSEKPRGCASSTRSPGPMSWIGNILFCFTFLIYPTNQSCMPFARTAFAELLSGAAFRPADHDSLVPLANRFKGRSLLILSIGTRTLRTGVVRYEGELPELHVSDRVARPPEDQLPGYLRMLSLQFGKPQPKHAVLLLSAFWSAELLENLSTSEAAPKADSITVGIPHPTLAGGVRFTVPLRTVRESEELLLRSGFEPVRVQIPAASLLHRLVQIHPPALRNADILLADAQSFLFIACEEGRWARLRFASNRPGELASDLSRHLRERPHPEAPLVLAGDPALREWVAKLQPEAGVAAPFETHPHQDFHAACQL
jgi:hypothetical protein